MRTVRAPVLARDTGGGGDGAGCACETKTIISLIRAQGRVLGGAESTTTARHLARRVHYCRAHLSGAARSKAIGGAPLCRRATQQKKHNWRLGRRRGSPARQFSRGHLFVRRRRRCGAANASGARRLNLPLPTWTVRGSLGGARRGRAGERCTRRLCPIDAARPQVELYHCAARPAGAPSRPLSQPRRNRSLSRDARALVVLTRRRRRCRRRCRGCRAHLRRRRCASPFVSDGVASAHLRARPPVTAERPARLRASHTDRPTQRDTPGAV